MVWVVALAQDERSIGYIKALALIEIWRGPLQPDKKSCFYARCECQLRSCIHRSTQLYLQAISSSEVWNGLPLIVTQNLQGIIHSMLSSKARYTTKQYLRHIQKFLQWCKTNGVALRLPFHVSVVATYLFSIKNSVCSIASINTISAALRWPHSFTPDQQPNPLDNFFCKNIVESIRRTKGQPIRKKTPITSEIIKKIIDNFANEEASLKDLRTARLCTLGYAGFFRHNELKDIQPRHIQFFENYITIAIPKSKTDIYHKGNVVFIKRAKSKYCPVSLLTRYMQVGNITHDSDLPLFLTLIFHKSVSKYSLGIRALS